MDRATLERGCWDAMAGHDLIDVVDDVLRHLLAHEPRTTRSRLHLLAYYCQAWYLVWEQVPLFASPIEAVESGPVIPDIDLLLDSPTGLEERASRLSDTQRLTIDTVIEAYAAFDDRELGELARSERPWQLTRNQAPTEQSEARNTTIQLDVMREFYASVEEELEGPLLGEL